MIEERYEELLQRHVDGDTTAAEEEELRAELEANPALRGRRDELNAVVQLLAEAEPVEPPAGLREAIARDVRAARRARSPHASPLGALVARLTPGHAYAFAAGAAVVLLVTLLPGWRPEPMDPGAVPGAMVRREEGGAPRTLALPGARADVRAFSAPEGVVVELDVQADGLAELEVLFAAPALAPLAFERRRRGPGGVRLEAGSVRFTLEGEDRVRVLLAGAAAGVGVRLRAGERQVEAEIPVLRR